MDTYQFDARLPIAVIGGGLAGLAAACTLGARGHKVVLFEKNDWLGGKAAVFEQDGFRFDMGPTILTVPRVLAKIFAEAGRDMNAALDLRRLDPQWRCFFDDNSVLDLQEDMSTMSDNLRRYAPGTEAGYRDFIGMSAKLHEVSEKFFFWRSVEDVMDTLDFRKNMDLDTLRDVLSLRMGTTVAGQIRKRVKDARVAQMLDHFVQYVGSSPYGSPAVLCSIAHMQTNDGVWYPIGGTRAVPVALEKLARELGVEIHTGTGVSRIVSDQGRVTAIETDTGDTVEVSAVVSNMDSVRTMRELVGGAPEKSFAKRWKREPACSGVVFYLGLDRAYEHLAHHDFVFSRDPEEEFDYIYHRGEPAPDPTCYIAAPSRTEPGVAPPGGEALYILVHTPYLRPHHDWSIMLPDYRRVIFDKLARTAGMQDLAGRICVERVLTPQDIHDRYRVLNGAIYGLVSHGRMFGAFKPGNRSRDLAGLYLAGGAAHPGPGMPMVLMSGWIAADTLHGDMCLPGEAASPARKAAALAPAV
jgi:phytoene desaturase